MRVFITGITGTLGTALARFHSKCGDQVYGCARNESVAVNWERYEALAKHCNLYIANANALLHPNTDVGRLLPTMGRLYHCAAMKHVDTCERFPDTAFRQNVILTSDIATVCRHHKVPMVFASTDKACMPNGVYGATKLIAESICLHHNMAVVRFGNLIASSGSVLSVWREALTVGKKLRLTNPDMTRYFIRVEDAASFMATRYVMGVVTIPDPMRSARLGDIAFTLAKGNADAIEVTGARPGETQYQWLISPQETARVEEGRLVLKGSVRDADKTVSGLSSETAEKWNLEELLRV